MVNELLVNLVNSVLGTGKRTARGNQSYHCPFCNHAKPKLEVNFSENKKGYNPWHCWVCDKKGTRISTLFKQIKAAPEKFTELFKLVANENERKIVENVIEVKLPKEFTPITNNAKGITGKQAWSYLRNRGLTMDDVYKYNLGYCEYGNYKNMVIIPSYDENGHLNFFTGRSFEKDPYRKYRNPEASRDIVPFELFINWKLPLVLCEGPFDAIAIKRNAIPLLGNNIQSKLMKKIVTSTIKKIYIALDTDAMKKALKFAQDFINQGKEVYLVELQGKDPSEMGFKNFTKHIQTAEQLDLQTIMQYKLGL